jgi:hypothetical protein
MVLAVKGNGDRGPTRQCRERLEVNVEPTLDLRLQRTICQ